MRTTRNIVDAGEKLGGAVKDDFVRRGGDAKKRQSVAALWPLPNWQKLAAGLKIKHENLTDDEALEIAATLCIAREQIIERQKKLNSSSGRRQFSKYYQDAAVVEAMKEYIAGLQDYVTLMAFVAGPPADDVFFFASVIADDDKAEAVLNAAGLGPFDNRLHPRPVSRAARLQQHAIALIEDGWPGAKIAPKRGKAALPQRPRLDTLERRGPDHRKKCDVDPEAIIATFGVRGVEFGNWVSDDERQAAVNLAFEAFHDFADVLGIAPSGVGMQHKLGIGFGSRGRGFGAGGIRAAAHYEPNRVVINLTRFNGDGSLAHEMGHMFEHGLREFAFGEGVQPFASKHWNYPERRPTLLPNAGVNAAFLSVMDTIMKEDPNHVGAGWRRSPFLIQAFRLGKGYWAKPREMFARAFETYVFDWLGERGRTSQYLVHGIESSRFADHPRGNPYPTGEQRQRINAAMANLIGVWREKDGPP